MLKAEHHDSLHVREGASADHATLAWRSTFKERGAPMKLGQQIVRPPSGIGSFWRRAMTKASPTQSAAPKAKPAHLSATKRILDLVVACTALAFFAPLLIVVAALVKLDSPGPVFFRQRRTGLHGIEFRIYKFRSMAVLEDGPDVVQANKDDKRVTRFGGVLRRSSFDELPQLFNVLLGDMSLVGPRPHALAHDQYYGALVPQYAKRFRVKPGITGLAQVRGLRGETRTIDDMAARVHLDNAYIENWKPSKDIAILFMTLLVVPFQKTAY